MTSSLSSLLINKWMLKQNISILLLYNQVFGTITSICRNVYQYFNEHREHLHILIKKVLQTAFISEPYSQHWITELDEVLFDARPWNYFNICFSKVFHKNFESIANKVGLKGKIFCQTLIHYSKKTDGILEHFTDRK